MSATRDIFTSREVHFEGYPRTKDRTADDFMDALADHFYEARGLLRLVFLRSTPAISASNKTFFVSGWPWWLPKWTARRIVANVAARTDIGGAAHYVIERCVL